jgi:two-component system, NarL family, nitrate/nitrite response regulator NarL
MDQVSIYLVGGSKLFRHGVRSYLNEDGFVVTGEFDDHVTASTAMDNGDAPDLVLYAKPGQDADPAAAVEALRDDMPETPVLVMAEALDTVEFSASLNAGVSGYLLSDISRDALVHSIRLILLGEKVFATELAKIWLSGGLEKKLHCAKKLDHKLTGRESEILECLLGGESNKIIARRLEITESTVKIHMKSLLRKINVQNRTQAAIWAMEAGFSGSGLNG